MKRARFSALIACIAFCALTAPAEEDWQAISDKADAAYKAWAYEEAAVLYEKLVRNADKTPLGNAKAQLRLGDCLYRLGRHVEAKIAYERCISLDLKSAEADGVYPRLADCYVKLGQEDHAREIYKAAMQKDRNLRFDIDARVKRVKGE